jgi:hypothetical protein
VHEIEKSFGVKRDAFVPCAGSARARGSDGAATIVGCDFALVEVQVSPLSADVGVALRRSDAAEARVWLDPHILTRVGTASGARGQV